MARRGKRVKLDQLAPKIAEGYTDRPMTPEDARREFPARRPEESDAGHMRGGTVPGSRVPSPTMILLPDDTVIEEPNTGRRFHDVKVVVTKEMRDAILSGYMCLKCKEPFPDDPWPLVCEVCGYEVQKRQVIDAAHELDGEVHIGPSKPLKEFMADLELRQEEALFRQKIRAGASPMKGAA